MANKTIQLMDATGSNNLFPYALVASLDFVNSNSVISLGNSANTTYTVTKPGFIFFSQSGSSGTTLKINNMEFKAGSYNTYPYIIPVSAGDKVYCSTAYNTTCSVKFISYK